MYAKICGICLTNDALFSAEKGAWALGFDFYKQSPRYIVEDEAKKIILQLKGAALKVGIFLNTDSKTIVRTMEDLGLDFAQVYEDIDAPGTLKARMIYALQGSREAEIPPQRILDQYGYLLFTGPKEHVAKEAGRLSNWGLAAKLARDYKLILSGGLTPTNVTAAIDWVAPFAVDVVGGVEKTTRVKEPAFIDDFLKACTRRRL